MADKKKIDYIYSFILNSEGKFEKTGNFDYFQIINEGAT